MHLNSTAGLARHESSTGTVDPAQATASRVIAASFLNLVRKDPPGLPVAALVGGHACAQCAAPPAQRGCTGGSTVQHQTAALWCPGNTCNSTLCITRWMAPACTCACKLSLHGEDAYWQQMSSLRMDPAAVWLLCKSICIWLLTACPSALRWMKPAVLHSRSECRAGLSQCNCLETCSDAEAGQPARCP